MCRKGVETSLFQCMWGKRFSIKKEWNAKYIYNLHVSLWWDFVSTKRRGDFSKETKVKSVRGINHIYSPLYSVSFAFLIHTDFRLLLLLACVASACKPPEDAPLAALTLEGLAHKGHSPEQVIFLPNAPVTREMEKKEEIPSFLW